MTIPRSALAAAIRKTAIAMTAVTALAGRAAAAPSDILFVLDGSGSMWGQIEGIPKIEAAKKTITRLMDDVPAQARLGFMTYGTTSKDDCQDVSVLNAIGSERGAIKASVAGLQPLGKTPLHTSLQQGISLLSRTEPSDVRKSLVLISDGIETCDGDPCAIARQAKSSGVAMKIHVVGFDVDAEARAQLECIAKKGNGQYFNASDTEGFATAMREVVQVAQAAPEPAPEPVSQRVFFDDFEGEALSEGDWVVDNRDPDAFIVENSRLLLVNAGRGHPNTAGSPNRFMLKRPVPDGDWDAVITFTAEFRTGADTLWFGLWTDAENYLGGQIYTDYSSMNCAEVTLRNRKNSSGEETIFDKNLFKCGNSKDAKSWIDSFADATPYTLGLHKRGRNYHVSLGRNGQRQYETDKLSSLRLPGKALAIVAGKWDANHAGEVQVMIDSIKITPVSE